MHLLTIFKNVDCLNQFHAKNIDFFRKYQNVLRCIMYTHTEQSVFCISHSCYAFDRRQILHCPHFFSFACLRLFSLGFEPAQIKISAYIDLDFISLNVSINLCTLFSTA